MHFRKKILLLQFFHPILYLRGKIINPNVVYSALLQHPLNRPRTSKSLNESGMPSMTVLSGMGS